MKKVFAKTPNAKKFYCFVKSMLKIASSFPLLHDENNIPIISEFDKASFFNKSFQKVLKKIMNKKKF